MDPAVCRPAHRLARDRPRLGDGGPFDLTGLRLAAASFLLAACGVGTSPSAPTASPAAPSGTPVAVESATPAPSPTALQTAAPASKTFEGFGFTFEYPGTWQEIEDFEHIPPRGPTILAATGLGDFELACTGPGAASECTPTWTVPDDGVVLVYWFGAWDGISREEPQPTLGPGASMTDVGGRRAIRLEEDGRSRWSFDGAPEAIEARWGPATGTAAAAAVERVIDSWVWDWMKPLDGPVDPPSEPFNGVLDLLRPGWSMVGDARDLDDFDRTRVLVYGPMSGEVPPEEGPGRIALYQTFAADTSFLDERIAASKADGGRAVPVTVYGRPAEVWVNDASGELLLGWPIPDGVLVLVANTLDYTVDQLVVAAHYVNPCCG